MQVYFAAPRKGLHPMWDDTYTKIIQFIDANGHKCKTQYDPILAAPTIRSTQADLRTAYNEAAYQQMENWVTSSECMIAECSNESTITGIAIMRAAAKGIHTLIMHKEGTSIDPTVAGVPNVKLAVWEDLTDIGLILARFLKKIDDLHEGN